MTFCLVKGILLSFDLPHFTLQKVAFCFLEAILYCFHLMIIKSLLYICI